MKRVFWIKPKSRYQMVTSEVKELSLFRLLLLVMHMGDVRRPAGDQWQDGEYAAGEAPRRGGG